MAIIIGIILIAIYLIVLIKVFDIKIVKESFDIKISKENLKNMTESKSTDKLQLLTELAKSLTPNVSEIEGFLLTWEEFEDSEGDSVVVPNVEIKKIIFK